MTNRQQKIIKQSISAALYLTVICNVLGLFQLVCCGRYVFAQDISVISIFKISFNGISRFSLISLTAIFSATMHQTHLLS